MIEKLENAGLGYYVKSGDTRHKLGNYKLQLMYQLTLVFLSYLGNIPLRNLVYRVIELPSSMQSLVYDFGQLSSDTEKDYIVKIVEKYVWCNERDSY